MASLASILYNVTKLISCNFSVQWRLMPRPSAWDNYVQYTHVHFISLSLSLTDQHEVSMPQKQVFGPAVYVQPDLAFAVTDSQWGLLLITTVIYQPWIITVCGGGILSHVLSQFNESPHTFTYTLKQGPNDRTKSNRLKEKKNLCKL